jgi:hypothetical protein
LKFPLTLPLSPTGEREEVRKKNRSIEKIINHTRKKSQEKNS